MKETTGIKRKINSDIDGYHFASKSNIYMKLIQIKHQLFDFELIDKKI